jgi:hypothetical protein
MRSVNPNTGIKGMDIVLANVNREIAAIHRRTNEGLIKAAIFIRREMDHTPPLIPVDTGAMRLSWFVLPISTFSTDKATVGIVMGFTANYALYVHEMLGEVNWSRKNSGPKFFEHAIKRNKDKIVKIISENVKIR